MSGVRVCWYMGACEGVGMCRVFECAGIWVRVNVVVCVGCSSVLVYG